MKIKKQWPAETRDVLGIYWWDNPPSDLAHLQRTMLLTYSQPGIEPLEVEEVFIVKPEINDFVYTKGPDKQTSMLVWRPLFEAEILEGLYNWDEIAVAKLEDLISEHQIH